MFIEFADRSLPGKFFIISAKLRVGVSSTKHFAAYLKFKNLSLAQLPFVSRIVTFWVSTVWISVWQENNAVPDIWTTLDSPFSNLMLQFCGDFETFPTQT